MLSEACILDPDGPIIVANAWATDKNEHFILMLHMLYQIAGC